jgi:hypothetical protein
MKRYIITFLIAFFVLSQFSFAQKIEANLIQDKAAKDDNNRTNDFYDNSVTYFLPQEKEIEVGGEIENPGSIDLSKFPLHSVIVKEALLNGNTTEFVGAYRYDGVSLLDILNEYVLAKKNAKDFRPIVDLYVEIENDEGDKVKISWGEIFYPIHLHEIIIATKVMHIAPTKTDDYWPIPQESRLIIASDLITCRNISNPSKITVKSLDKHFVVNKGMENMWSDQVLIKVDGKQKDVYTELPSELPDLSYPNIFYGKGRGIHSVTPMIGSELKAFIAKYIPLNEHNLRTGMITISALDGYRSAFTVGEIMNRNDQSEFMIIDKNNYEGAGRFSVYPASDFFSDRAMKAVTEIHIDLKK